MVRAAALFVSLYCPREEPNSALRGGIRSIPETLDHFFILNRVFYHYYTTTLLIILITTLQIRIIRVQVVINRLLLGSRWLLTRTTGTRVEINLDAVVICDLAKELLDLKFARSAGSPGRGTRRLLDGLEELNRIILRSLLSLGGSLGIYFRFTFDSLSELNVPAFLELSQLLCV